MSTEGQKFYKGQDLLGALDSTIAAGIRLDPTSEGPYHLACIETKTPKGIKPSKACVVQPLSPEHINNPDHYGVIFRHLKVLDKYEAVIKDPPLIRIAKGVILTAALISTIYAGAKKGPIPALWSCVIAYLIYTCIWPALQERTPRELSAKLRIALAANLPADLTKMFRELLLVRAELVRIGAKTLEENLAKATIDYVRNQLIEGLGLQFQPKSTGEADSTTIYDKKLAELIGHRHALARQLGGQLSPAAEAGGELTSIQ